MLISVKKKFSAVACGYFMPVRVARMPGGGGGGGGGRGEREVLYTCIAPIPSPLPPPPFPPSPDYHPRNGLTLIVG